MKRKKNPAINKYDLSFKLNQLLQKQLGEKELNLFASVPVINRNITDNLLSDIANLINEKQSQNIDDYRVSEFINRGGKITIKYGANSISTPVIYSESLVNSIDPQNILKIDRQLKQAYSRGVSSDLRNNI